MIIKKSLNEWRHKFVSNLCAVETNGSGSKTLSTRRHTLSKVRSLLITSKSFKMDTEV